MRDDFYGELRGGLTGERRIVRDSTGHVDVAAAMHCAPDIDDDTFCGPSFIKPRGAAQIECVVSGKLKFGAAE